MNARTCQAQQGLGAWLVLFVLCPNGYAQEWDILALVSDGSKE